jgi:hypothetical protein
LRSPSIATLPLIVPLYTDPLDPPGLRHSAPSPGFTSQGNPGNGEERETSSGKICFEHDERDKVDDVSRGKSKDKGNEYSNKENQRKQGQGSRGICNRQKRKEVRRRKGMDLGRFSFVKKPSTRSLDPQDLNLLGKKSTLCRDRLYQRRKTDSSQEVIRSDRKDGRGRG